MANFLSAVGRAQPSRNVLDVIQGGISLDQNRRRNELTAAELAMSAEQLEQTKRQGEYQEQLRKEGETPLAIEAYANRFEGGAEGPMWRGWRRPGPAGRRWPLGWTPGLPRTKRSAGARPGVPARPGCRRAWAAPGFRPQRRDRRAGAPSGNGFRLRHLRRHHACRSRVFRRFPGSRPRRPRLRLGIVATSRSQSPGYDPRCSRSHPAVGPGRRPQR